MVLKNRRFTSYVDGFERAQKTKLDEFPGHSFDSKTEAARALQLHEMQAKGEIWDLELQPKYQLSDYPRVVVRLDFRYKEPWKGVGWATVVEDVKGTMDRDARVRFAWLLEKIDQGVFPPMNLRITKKKGKRFVEWDWKGRVGVPRCSHGKCRRGVVFNSSFCALHQGA